MSLISYLKETKSEFSHVTWPTRKQTITFTVIVIVVSVATALFLSLFDRLFAAGLQKLLPF